MKNLLITSVSEQTIPNVLCVEYFKPDAILFITTERMEKEKKIESTLKSLELIFRENKYTADNNVHTLKVQEDSISDIIQKSYS